MNRMRTYRLNITISIEFNLHFGFNIDIYKNGKECIELYNGREEFDNLTIIA